MANFEALIKATLDTAKAKSDYSSFKSSIEKDIIKIKIDADFAGNNSTFAKNIQDQFQAIGKSASQSLTKGFNKNPTFITTPTVKDFAKAEKAFENYKKSIAKQVKDTDLGFDNKSSERIANKYIKNEANIAKQVEKARQQYQKQINTVSNEYWKQEFNNQFQDKYTKSPELENMKKYYQELEKESLEAAKQIEKESLEITKQVEKIRSNVLNNTYEAKSSSLTSKLSPYSNQDTELLNQAREQAALYDKTLSDLKRHFDSGDTFKMNDQEVVNSFNTMNNAAKTFDNTMTQIKNTGSKDLGIGVAERSANSVKSYYEANTKALKKYGAELKDLENRYRSVKTEEEKLTLDNQFKNLKANISADGLTGKNRLDEASRAFKQIGQFALTYGIIQKLPQLLSQSVNELREIDTIITEISKAADAPVKQLKELRDGSFSVASKYGQNASDYLLGVQEMTRAGYFNSSEMAELSTLAQSAGDMTADLANQYLIASDMAYGYGGNVEKLNALLDAQNQITNRNAVNMTELAEATKLVASQAAQSGIAEDEMTAAISTMIATTQQGGQVAARAFRGILMNLQQVSGELDNGEVIDEESFKKVESRLNSVGVKMEEIRNGAAVLRDPMEVLKELAEVYNSLPDDSVDKAGIISDLGGKYRGNQLAALLSNWDKYEKILGDYQNAEGSAAQEAEKTAQSWEGSLNRLKNTWTDLVANFVDAGATSNIINMFSGILSVIDQVAEALGGFKTAFSVVTGGFLSKNGLGKLNVMPLFIK